MKRYIVRGVVAPHGANYTLVGQYTYLNEAYEGWPVWDGEHRATRYSSRVEALEQAKKAAGPFFRMPDPDTIEVLEVE